MTAYDARTALIVVDVQNDFADPDGNLYVPGGEQIIPVVNDQVTAAREAGAPIAYTQDWHPADTPHFADHGGTWPVHCVQETWGAELHPALEVADQSIRIRKGQGRADGYSAFHVQDTETEEVEPTGLRAKLEELGVEAVVVVGLAQDVCVKATALDARDAGFATTVLTDATRPVDLEPGDGDRALEELARAGVVRASSS